MRVNLAAQVLSASVSAVLKSFGPPESHGTATHNVFGQRKWMDTNIKIDDTIQQTLGNMTNRL